MVEPTPTPGEEQRRPQSPNGGDDHDDLPNDPAELKRLLAEEKRLRGQLINESKKTKAERTALSEAMKRWSSLGTPEEVEAALAERNAQEMDKARDKGEIDKLLENQRKKFEKDLQQKDQMLAAERDLNNKVLLDAVLREELAKVCDPDLLEGAFALHRPKIIMIEDPESEYGRRAVASVGGDQMAVGDFVKNWADTNDKAIKYLKPSLAAGGGATGGGTARTRVKKRSQMTVAEKAAYIREHGKDAYFKLEE